MNAYDMRRLALQMPEAEEKSHFGKADFRVRNRIFATLPDVDTAVVKLTLEQQEMLTDAEPAIFAPVPGGWGRQGWTRVALIACDETTMVSTLWMAWRNAAPAAAKKRGRAAPRLSASRGPAAQPFWLCALVVMTMPIAMISAPSQVSTW